MTKFTSEQNNTLYLLGGRLDIESSEQLEAIVKHVVDDDRDTRQLAVHNWCKAAFGAAHASSVEQRAVRFLEEAIELYQACGGSSDMAHQLINYIFNRPVGYIAQEFGGVDVTLLALAQACGLSAEDLGKAEFERVLKKPLADFTKRNQVKNEAGFNVIATAEDNGFG